MKTRYGIVLFLSLLVTPVYAQGPGFPKERRDPILEQKLMDLAQGFQGTAGIYVRHLKTGTTATFNADSLFPTASMIKVPILCGLFDRIERGELKYDSAVVYRDSMKYDDGITGSFKDSTRIAVAELVHLMITVSDNTASLWLQALAGTGTAINDLLEKNGFHSTRVNSRTPGREGFRSIFGWGVTSPREMAELMARIYQQQLITQAASEEMFRVLTKPYWDGEAVSQIPPQVQVASKSGAVNASKSETVLVNAPSGSYVFCVITKNQKDQQWKNDNEGYVLIRNVSKTLWSYFEPQSTWKPPAGREKWVK
jgi:beta-lactamase class A